MQRKSRKSATYLGEMFCFVLEMYKPNFFNVTVQLPMLLFYRGYARGIANTWRDICRYFNTPNTH